MFDTKKKKNEQCRTFFGVLRLLLPRSPWLDGDTSLSHKRYRPPLGFARTPHSFSARGRSSGQTVFHRVSWSGRQCWRRCSLVIGDVLQGAHFRLSYLRLVERVCVLSVEPGSQPSNLCKNNDLAHWSGTYLCALLDETHLAQKWHFANSDTMVWPPQTIRPLEYGSDQQEQHWRLCNDKDLTAKVYGTAKLCTKKADLTNRNSTGDSARISPQRFMALPSCVQRRQI